MRLPDSPSLLFLAYVLVLLPWLAFRSGRKMKAAMAGQVPVTKHSREAVWYSTIVTQCCMLVLAWIVGRDFDYEIFALPKLLPSYIAAAFGALAALFVFRALARATRSDDERRKMVVYFLAPRTAREWQLKTVTVLIACINEEATYRGVAFSILWYSTESALIAVLLCSIAFALAHWVQGWKSMLVIFGIALVMHALVLYTQTLVLAMVVHAIYDFVAIYLIWKESLRLNLNIPA